jgi:hypothetical protein
MIQFDSKKPYNLEEKTDSILRLMSENKPMLKTVHNEDEVGNSEAETKRDKFVKLAEGRTRNAIAAIRVIGKLGNKNAYDFDDADVQKIVRALSREVDALKTRMSSSTGKETIDFKL